VNFLYRGLTMPKQVIRLLLIMTTIFSLSGEILGAEKAARAIIVKGNVTYIVDGKSDKVKRNQWLPEGAQVSTAKGSFAKLMFIDRSSINVGPESQMKIESFPKDKAGIISLVKGKIRSKVSKNYMNNSETDKSKLFIKTKTAAMGVRGTDFQVSFNNENNATSLVTFEGAVAMGQINGDLGSFDQNKLESIVSNDQAVVVRRGQFSGASPKQEKVTAPTKISPVQLETLEKNEVPGMSAATNGAESTTAAPAPAPTKKYRSIVPPGMDAKEVANSSSSLDSSISEAAGAQAVALVPEVAPVAAAPEMENTPKAGGFIDIETAQYIPPPANSTYDANAGVYVPPADVGHVDPATGNYANDHYTLNPDGSFSAKADAPSADSAEDNSRGIASVAAPAPAAPQVMDASAPAGSEEPLGFDGNPSIDPTLVENISNDNETLINDFQNSDNNQVYGSENTTNVTVKPVVQ